MNPKNRTTRGKQILQRLHGQWGMPRVLDPLNEVAPDLVTMVRDFAFGEIYARPGLDLKARQLVTVTALAAMGNDGIEFKAHLHGALNVGWTRQELVEALMQIAIYAGFPAAIHALLAAKEVFAEREKSFSTKAPKPRRPAKKSNA